MNATADQPSGYTVAAKDILEGMNDAFCALTQDLRIVLMNRRAMALWNLTQCPAGLPLTTLFPELVGSELEKALIAIPADGASRQIEMIWPRNGVPLQVDIQAFTPCIHLYLRDIASYRDLKDELRRSHEALMLAEQSAGIGVWDMDLKTQTMQGTQQFFKIMGLPPSTESISMDVIRRLRPLDEQAKLTQGFQQAVESRSDFFESEYPINRPDGQTRWIFGRGRVVRDAAGEPARYSGIDIDITERKAAELALYESELRLRELNEKLEYQVEERARELASSRAQMQAFFDNSPDWLTLQRITSDGTSIYVDLNPAAEAAYGLSRQQVIGRKLEEILGEDAAQVPLHHLRECLRTGQPQRYVVRRTMAGRTRTIDVMFVLVPSGGSGGERHIITTARDITEREELEAQLHQAQKTEAIGQLTGGIAHDFNNLLTPIYSALDLLQRRLSPDDRTARIISGALQSAERARVLVGRLLSFARRQHLDARPVVVPELVRGMVDLIDRSLGPLTQVRLEMASDLPTARVDPNQLELALLNLCVNARDAMPRGGTLVIGADAAEILGSQSVGLAPGQYVRLSVTDTGVGMDSETLRRAIEPFYTTKGVGKGTGLGLSMVHGLAAQSGGALVLESTPGKGTTATLYLPIADPQEAVRPDEAPGTPPMQLRKLTILLVDDEELVRMGLSDTLEGQGHCVIQAGSGAEALQRLRTEPAVELVITDYMMPSMTGVDLVRKARDLYPGLPALLVTGYSALDAATVDHLPRINKPFRESDLIFAIAAAMEKQTIISPSREVKAC